MKTSSKRLLSGLFVLGLALAAGAGQASAGDDPYGATTTTTEPPGVLATCELSVTAGAPGASVTATVSNVPQGQTVRILFDGQEVGRGTATTTVEVDFVVPDRPPGDYLVTAVGATFTVECGADGDVLFSVLAAAQEPGGGPLPKTGIYVGLLVVVAGALLLAGRTFVAESKRRRRRAARSAGSRTRAGV